MKTQAVVQHRDFNDVTPNGYDTNLGHAILNATLPTNQRAIVRSYSQNGVRSLHVEDNEAVKRRRVISGHTELEYILQLTRDVYWSPQRCRLL